MKFVLFVLDTESNSGSPEELKDIDTFNEGISEAGQLVMAAVLASSANGTLVDSTGGNSKVEAGSLNGEVF